MDVVVGQQLGAANSHRTVWALVIPPPRCRLPVGSELAILALVHTRWDNYPEIDGSLDIRTVYVALGVGIDIYT